MTVRFYPPINEKDINIVANLYDEEPTYLDDPSCPYSLRFKSLIKAAGNQSNVAPSLGNVDLDAMLEVDNLQTEISTLYAHLKEFGQSMRDSDSSSEKNTYFKLSASLLEKLIDMKERVSNINDVNTFIETVLSIMATEITVDDRAKVLKRLNEVLDK